jgi:DNA-binding MarR family transcriptional regulator
MDVNETNFLYALTKIRQKLFKFLENELAKEGISDVAPSIGDILYALDMKGKITMQELARHTMKDKSTISTVINKLEAVGYIKKEKDAGDARFTHLTLTAKARKVRPVLFGISKKMNARLFEGMSEKDKAALFMLLGKVSRNL